MLKQKLYDRLEALYNEEISLERQLEGIRDEIAELEGELEEDHAV